jgi:hypothetical protein
MADVRTGWGVEFLFYKLVGRPKQGVAILDDHSCYHPSGDSSLDRFVPRGYHYNDAHKLMSKYSYEIYTPRVLGGIRKRKGKKLWGELVNQLLGLRLSSRKHNHTK